MAAFESDSGIGFDEVDRGRLTGEGIGRPTSGGGFGDVIKGMTSRLPMRVFKGGGGEGGGDADDWDERCGFEDAVDAVGDAGAGRSGARKALSGLESRVWCGIGLWPNS